MLYSCIATIHVEMLLSMGNSGLQGSLHEVSSLQLKIFVPTKINPSKLLNYVSQKIHSKTAISSENCKNELNYFLLKPNSRVLP
jgi:hypothetical protein